MDTLIVLEELFKLGEMREHFLARLETSAKWVLDLATFAILPIPAFTKILPDAREPFELFTNPHASASPFLLFGTATLGSSAQ